MKLEEAWEASLRQPPLLRALTLLQMAEPETPIDQLLRFGIGERDRRLLDLRERLAGPRFDAIATCPKCAERSEFSFDANDLRSQGCPSPPEAVEITRDGWSLSARLPDTSDLLAVARSVTAEPRKILLERCLKHAMLHGQAVLPEAIPADVIAALQEALAAADPMADLEVGVTCAGCGEPYTIAFDIAGYLWQEIDERARRLLRDVHTLARSYGWREADILAMSDFRRQQYLDMVAGQ